MTVNKNILSPNKFRVLIQALPDTEVLAQTIALPDISGNIVPQYTNQWLDAHKPGDKISYSDLQISFIIDEDLTNYKAIKDWIEKSVRGIEGYQFTDITVYALTNNSTPNVKMIFKNCTPYNLPGFNFDVATDEGTPVVVTVPVKVGLYEIE